MTVGFTCGAFDLLHAGHIHFLKSCSDRCDRLMVGLHSDPQIDRPYKNKPIQSLYERWVQLNGCEYVSNIIPYDTENDLTNMLATLDYDVRFVGSEYLDTILTGQSVCEKLNKKIVYIDRLHNYSSTELRQRIKGE